MAAEWSTNYSNLSATCHTCTYSCIISLHPTQENGQVRWHSSPQPGIHCSNTETVAQPMPFNWHRDILQAKIWVLVLFPDKPCNLLMKASPTTKLLSAFPLPWHHLDQERSLRSYGAGQMGNLTLIKGRGTSRPATHLFWNSRSHWVTQPSQYLFNYKATAFEL